MLEKVLLHVGCRRLINLSLSVHTCTAPPDTPSPPHPSLAGQSVSVVESDLAAPIAFSPGEGLRSNSSPGGGTPNHQRNQRPWGKNRKIVILKQRLVST